MCNSQTIYINKMSKSERNKAEAGTKTTQPRQIVLKPRQTEAVGYRGKAKTKTGNASRLPRAKTTASRTKSLYWYALKLASWSTDSCDINWYVCKLLMHVGHTFNSCMIASLQTLGWLLMWKCDKCTGESREVDNMTSHPILSTLYTVNSSSFSRWQWPVVTYLPC